MKINGIKKKQHVYADYTYVPLVLAAPFISGFEQNKAAAITCRAIAVSALTYSLCTKAKWGLLKIISYRTHAALDLASGVLALAVSVIPQVKKDKPARNTFFAMGVTGLLVGTLSMLGAAKTKSKNKKSKYFTNH